MERKRGVLVSELALAEAAEERRGVSESPSDLVAEPAAPRAGKLAGRCPPP
jgi:hypothetical protein